MRPIQFDHVALALPRMADAPAVLVGVLGGAPAFGMTTPKYRFGQWRFAGGGRIEVLEPWGPEDFLHRFVAARGPGIHHVTFKVPSLDEVCARARAHGYEIVGESRVNPQWMEAFLHPRQALGIVVQLAQAGTGEGVPHDWQAPPGPPDPPPAVTLVGLRLRARSVERARTQWQAVLRGEESRAEDGAYVYRWPRSPLRLAVEIHPDAEEGPVAIEVQSDRALALPAGPYPALGAAFAVVKR